MNKKKLNVDLLICNTLNFDIALKTLEYNSQFFNFNKKILLSNKNETIKEFEVYNVGKFKSIQDYSDFMPQLINYVEADHLLLIQDDGHIVNPNLWDDEYLKYDYIGAPWPSSKKWLKRFKKYDYFDEISKNFKKNRVGNGGFSLRSKKFLEYCSTFQDCAGVPEDIYFCILNYEKSQNYGINFAPFEISYKFSAEHNFGHFFKKHPISNSKFEYKNHFGWHGKRFINSNELMELKNTL